MAIPQALTPEQIAQIVAAGRGNTVNIGGTLYGGNWADIGDGESRQEGPLQNIYGSTGIDQAGQPYYEYSPTGSFVRQGVTNKSQSFFGGLADSLKDPVVLAALGGAAYGGLFGGAGAGATGLTASELAAADMALGGAGGTAGAEALASAASAGGAGLTASQLANLAKAGISLAGITAGANALSNTNNNATATPITYSGGGAGGYSPDYFSQVQSTYNQLMPGVPRDVATPLQQWYSTEFNPGQSITGSLFGDMTGGTTTTGLKPVTTPVTKPITTVIPKTTTIVGGGGNDTITGGGGNNTVVNKGSAGYQYATQNLGWTPSQYIDSINQWVIDNPRATKKQIDAAVAQAGISDADIQTALGMSNFSDATKYALTHGGSLQELGNTIVDWINANPTATNAQIQAEQAKWGISDQDIANALYGLNSSAGKEWAVVQDMGLDQYYKNIADAAKSGITAEQAAAQMMQYGVSPADVKQAYSLFAPSGGLTLDEVLAAYNK